MTTSRRIALVALASILATVLAACSGGRPAQPTPPPVATYGPATQGGYAAPPRQPTYSPTPTARAAPALSSGGGRFTWHTRLADAQAQARREGKLILVGTTQAGCGLCEKFKNTIVPQAGAQVSPVAVGYMVNARTPEAPQVWRILKANLANERLMPLIGVLTPDLRYLTGFGGPPDTTKLMNALGTARRLYPVSARAEARPMPSRAGRGQALRNEYGEVEWTPLEQLWPEDPIAPDTGIAGDPTRPAAPQPSIAPEATPARPGDEPGAVVAEVIAAPASLAAPLPAEVAAIEPPELEAPAWGGAELTAAEIAARMADRAASAPIPPPDPAFAPERAPAPVRVPSPAPSPAPAPAPAPAPMPVAVAVVPPRPAGPGPTPPVASARAPEVEAWAKSALRSAYADIERGAYADARSTLAEVHARVPNTAFGREAMRGQIALYNAERIRDATGGERQRLVEEARRNLGRSMWGGLFS